MRYALNVTPINGWETHFGSGHSDAVLSAAGNGYRAFFAIGSQADMALAVQAAAGYLVITGFADDAIAALTASGSGVKAMTGAGVADQTLSAVGIPVLKVLPVGEATLALAVNGQALKALTGSGTADQALVVSGQAVKALTGDGTANQVLGVSGTGYLVITGQASDADMTLSALGKGYGAFFAAGETAVLTLSADGNGYRQLRGFGDTAMLECDAEGIALLYMHLSGSVGLDLAGTDGSVSPIAKLGAGQSDMAMAGLASIPNPIVIPATFSNTHYSRRLKIEAKDDGFTLSDENRRMIVPSESRVFAVPAERNT